MNEENYKDEELDAFLAEEEEKDLHEGMLTGTFSGEIRDKLLEIGEQENKPTDVKIFRLGRTEFYLDDDLCVLQDHYESPYMKHYINMVDLQKPWWRKAFLEHACEGSLKDVGLIAPSVLEVISQVSNKEAKSKFQMENILSKVKIDNVNQNSIAFGEFVDHEIYSDRDDLTIRMLIDKMVEFWKALVAPDFDVEFSNGGGDMLSKIRLIPLNEKAKDALMNGGEVLNEAIKKIVDNYDSLINNLKNV